MLACAHSTTESTPASGEEMPFHSFQYQKPDISDRREGKREKRRLQKDMVGTLGTEYDVNEHVKPAPQTEVSALPMLYYSNIHLIRRSLVVFGCSFRKAAHP